MTPSELQKILNNADRKLSLAELKQVIYSMKRDCTDMLSNLISLYTDKEIEDKEYLYNNAFYTGEHNAFQIVLDLLERLEVENERP